MLTKSTYPQLTSTQCTSFAVRTLRAEFEAQPPQRQRETLERVQRLLDDEQRRGQKQPSWLAQHAREIYGL